MQAILRWHGVLCLTLKVHIFHLERDEPMRGAKQGRARFIVCNTECGGPFTRVWAWI